MHIRLFVITFAFKLELVIHLEKYMTFEFPPEISVVYLRLNERRTKDLATNYVAP
jgi:hypothetical protein